MACLVLQVDHVLLYICPRGSSNTTKYSTKSIRTSLNEKNEKTKTIHTTQRESLVPFYCTNASKLRMNPCYVQLKIFTIYIMHVTYSYQHFSAFQMSILPLQFEPNLNSFLYFNKNVQS